MGATGREPPLVVDIDGTITGPERAVHPEALATIQAWDAPVVIATGKALPFPVALCEFAGRPRVVIAENGGIAFVDPTDELLVFGDRESAQAVAEEFVADGHDLGWGSHDMVNRWRETEIAVSRDAPQEPLEALAEEYGLDVVDTGFAYHVKSRDVSKGQALERVAERLGLDPNEFVAIGDSANDVSTFEVVGESYAVANADDEARAAADEITEEAYGDGFLDAVSRLRPGD